MLLSKIVMTFENIINLIIYCICTITLDDGCFLSNRHGVLGSKKYIYIHLRYSYISNLEIYFGHHLNTEYYGGQPTVILVYAGFGFICRLPKMKNVTLTQTKK